MKLCDVCVKRARLVGGNATCPVYRPGYVDGGRHREPETTGWPKHLKLYPHGCSSFLAGDLRAREPKADPNQGSLL